MIPTLRVLGRFGFYSESPDLKHLHCLFTFPSRCHGKSFKVDRIPRMTCVQLDTKPHAQNQTCLLRRSSSQKLSRLPGNHCGNLTRWGWGTGPRNYGYQLCVIAARPAAPGVRRPRPLYRAARGRPGPAPAPRQRQQQHGRPEPARHQGIRESRGPRVHTGETIVVRVSVSVFVVCVGWRP